MTAFTKTLQGVLSSAHSGILCCAVLLTAACAGCGGGLVYRTDPEPRQEFPVDISVEQDIYASTAKQPRKAEPAVEPAPPEKKPLSVPAEAADHFYSVHLFSFKRPDCARSAAQKIAAQTGQPVFVRETHLPGSGTWQRLYVGMFPSEAAAKAFGGKMKSEAVSPYFCVYKLSAPLAAKVHP